MTNKSMTFAAAMIVTALVARSASAGLLGASVDVTYDAPLLGTVVSDLGTTTVDGSVEYPNYNNLFSLSIGDNSLIFTELSTNTYPKTPFNGIEMKILSPVSLTSVSFDPASSYSFSTFGSLSGNELYMNLQGLTVPQGATIVLDFTTAVPEPTAWALMLVGFGGIGGAVRAHRSVSVA